VFGTVMIAAVAIVIAVPISVAAALFISEHALRRFSVAALLLAGTAVLAGCSSSPSTASGTTPSSTSSTVFTQTLPTLPGAIDMSNGHQYVVIDGKHVELPTERGTRAIDQTVDDGEQIMVTPSGFWPEQLFAAPHETVVFTNLTGEPQTITFEYSSIRSNVIAPAGGTWTWEADGVISYRYNNAKGQSGILEVSPGIP